MPEVVYKPGRSNGGNSTLHIDPECHRARQARKLFEKPIEAFPDWYIEDNACGHCWKHGG